MVKSRGERLLLLWSAAAALMPKCPLCLFALLGATGAAGTASLVWMPVVMTVSLLVTVAAACIRARMAGRYGAALLVLFVALAILAGRFVFRSTAVVYAGAAVLFGMAMFHYAVGRIRWHKPLAL